jgi:hypothetical protein
MGSLLLTTMWNWAFPSSVAPPGRSMISCALTVIGERSLLSRIRNCWVAAFGGVASPGSRVGALFPVSTEYSKVFVSFFSFLGSLGSRSVLPACVIAGWASALKTLPSIPRISAFALMVPMTRLLGVPGPPSLPATK